jgi:fatty-acyl-CoA synthase
MGPSIASIFEESARSHAEKAFHFPALGVSFTYAELNDRAHRVARVLIRRGVTNGRLVGLLFGTSPSFVTALFGVFCAGAVAVPLPQPSTALGLAAYIERLRLIMRDGGVRHVLVGDEFANFEVRFEEGVGLLRVEELLRESETIAEDLGATVTGTSLALVQYTSGSTSDPKGVALTHASVLAGIRAIVHGVRLGPRDINGQWLPLHHDMGLIGMMAGTVCGVTHHLWPPASFVRNPARWLSEFAARHATIYAGPNFSYASILSKTSEEALRALDLSEWRVAFNGSEVIDADCLEAFTKRFGTVGFHREAMFPVYGLAEVTLAAAFPALGSTPRADWVERDVLARGCAVRSGTRNNTRVRGIMVVGGPVLDHELRLVDAEGYVVHDGVVGEIEIRGPAVMHSYLGRAPGESGIRAGGWLATGDLGYMRDGALRVTGRIKEMIVVRGANYYPQDVETVVTLVAGVRRAVSFACGNGPDERIVVLFEGAQDCAHELTIKVRDAVVSELGLMQVEVCMMQPRALSRTTSGKYQRVLMRDRYRNGALGDALLARTHGMPGGCNETTGV